jgi:hypothetical protein
MRLCSDRRIGRDVGLVLREEELQSVVRGDNVDDEWTDHDHSQSSLKMRVVIAVLDGAGSWCMGRAMI